MAAPQKSRDGRNSSSAKARLALVAQPKSETAVVSTSEMPCLATLSHQTGEKGLTLGLSGALTSSPAK